LSAVMLTANKQTLYSIPSVSVCDNINNKYY